MSSTTAQQTKLNLELVPKENRLDIGKCNGRIPRRLTPREPTFQVVLDAIALTPCYPAFLITADVPEVYMHQFWNSVYKHDTFYRFKLDKKKRFKLTLEVSEISFRFAEEYMVETLIPFLLKKTLYASNLWRKRYQLRSMKGALYSQDGSKFKKASPSTEDTKLLLANAAAVYKAAGGRLIREAPKEVRKKSLRDFHKTHPSGSGIVAEKSQSVDKITPTVTSEGTGDKPRVSDVTEDDSNKSKYES
ncbi:hypothetical protein Tco_0093525 [Tanacetum coccineum]